MNSFTTIEKYAIIKVLSHIMKADGIIHIEDISNIDDIQTKLIISGMTDENKILAKVLFVGMAEADGTIHPKETEIINQFFI